VKHVIADSAGVGDALLRFSQIVGGAVNALAGSRGLSALQLQILWLLDRRDGTETVGNLARRFLISAPTVSDSLRVMAEKGLITKSRQGRDSRAVDVAITALGREAVAATAELHERLNRIISAWDENRRTEIQTALFALIRGLQSDSPSFHDRMCVTCRHFAINCDIDSASAPYYCRSLSTPLRATELRFDCSLYDSCA